MKDTVNIYAFFRVRRFAEGERIVKEARQERARQVEYRHQEADAQVR